MDISLIVVKSAIVLSIFGLYIPNTSELYQSYISPIPPIEQKTDQGFSVLFKKLLKIEGKQTNHPNDRGKNTKFGITQRTANQFGYSVNNLTEYDAYQIYFKYYWKQPKFNKIFQTKPKLASKLFLGGVHVGTIGITRWLQQCMRIESDGKIGSETLNALKKMNEFEMIECIGKKQKTYYRVIVQNDSTQKIFLMGWLNRI